MAKVSLLSVTNDKSSVISRLTYNSSDNSLTVTFLSSNYNWIYYDVPYETFVTLITSKSIGSYYNKLVRGKFKGKRLEEASSSVE